VTTDQRRLRVLIVDDEPLARQRLEDLLRHEERVDIVGMADNGLTAIESIRSLRPDLVFLDVQMPGKTGLEVVREIGASGMPPVIFVTAFDQYALQAFDVSAIDYLVKPFDDERFEQAISRARRMIELEEIGDLRERLMSLLEGKPSVGVQPKSTYLERIPVEMPGKVRVVPVADIQYFTASGPYMELHTAERTHLIRASIQSLEEQLDPAKFLRIHRSIIVRLDLIDTFIRGAGGDYEVVLKTGARLKVSRSRREELERRIGLS
jgi:two-component system, LytTR family, response regulator